MCIFDEWRQEIKALLPCGFLRISREAGFLFVSDFPARMSRPESVMQALEAAGFRVTLRGRLAFLDGQAEKYYQAAALDFPCAPGKETDANSRLLYAARLMIAKGEEENCFLAREVMRCTALKDEKALEKLPEELALCLRKRQPLSALAGKILLQYLNQKEDVPC